MSKSVRNGAVSEEVDRLAAEVVAEITDRLHAGEPVDVEDYIARHPELADRLRRLLPALAVLDRFSSSAGPAGSATEAGDAAEMYGTLGDFRLIREVGRGGMGVVYEAEQISLGRRVALKVLPFAATMDPRQLQRFHNEARAAASLHHEHIVPVHAVGCERAVHFYAMQFIEGESLAELIAVGARSVSEGHDHPSLTLRAPTDTRTVAAAATEVAPRNAAHYRRIAEWGTQAAEALEHAHALGIVHRDVKPANLIVDVQGKLWVTDFGLARTVTDAGLTMSGDLLGTLRYMSPEQALARHGLVDHRTDVYSLGATLYELLCGRPAIEGQDRREILRQIADEEPPPPRRHDPAVPADLETIILKALAKEPAERYATAQELADDLRRFLEDRPIVAKRPTLRQRARKWGQRHRHLAGATALFLALVVVGLAVSAFLLWREKEQTRVALDEARTNYARAETQRQRAETNFRQAFWAVEDLLKPFEPGHWLRPPTLAEVKQFQAEECLRLLATLSEDQSDEPAVRLQKGVAYIHTGRVYQVLDDHEKAQKAFRQAIAVFERLVQDFPDESAYPSEVGQAWGILAEDLYLAGNTGEGNACFSRAQSIYREAARNHPADPEFPRGLACGLCSWLDPKLRNPAEAVEMARRAVELAPDRMKSWMALGIAYYRTGQWGAAVNALQEAVRRTPGWPGGATTRGGPAVEAILFLAMAQWQSGQREEAMVSYRTAIGFMERSFNARDMAECTARSEAAALLGIQAPPPPNPKEESPRKD